MEHHEEYNREAVDHVRQATMAVISRATKRRNERHRFSTVPRSDHEEADTINPIYDKFYSIGSVDSVKSLTNFMPHEFDGLWYALKPRVNKHWNVGKGRKSPHTGKDVLFMLLAVFKNGGTWDVLAALFQLSSSTFERLICGFLMKDYPHMYELFVEDEANSLSITRLVAMGRTFKNFPCALYAVDATFQQSNRPLGPHNEALYAFSGKHHLYGKKVEVSVSPLGFAINVSDNVFGSIHDKTIFDNNRDFHMKMRAKRPNDYNLFDEGPLRTEYPDEWAV
ncbi:hypothetical protein Ae201684P_012807 [Aphanomyces euteiches]|uniref:DDE Tnp4 domain-containing protein n=1 Tax=Aphanomyces euteiches TaxID=100861 RepID=A0A6G0WZ28_9STRA|nr:hypothetical protein Ae201684_010150 [Aphanomyces euteiches]KAH9076321.1 hypothetical protein Ae201684P_012807 [Aphanomyces euteiches]